MRLGSDDGLFSRRIKVQDRRMRWGLGWGWALLAGVGGGVGVGLGSKVDM